MADTSRIDVNVNIQGDSSLDKVAREADAAAKAEEKYQKALARRKQQLAEQRRMKSDLEASGDVVPKQPKPKKPPKQPKPPKTLEEKAQEREARIAEQKAIRARLEERGVIERRKEKEKKPPKEPKRPLTIQEEVAQRVAAGRRAEQVKAGVQAATQTMGGRMASLGQGAQGLMGGGAMGMIGKAGPWGMAIAGAVMAIDAGAKKLTQGFTILGDSTLTSAQRMSKLRDEFIPFHQTFRELREAIDGTTDRIAQSELSKERGIGASSALGTFNNKMFSMEYRANEIKGRNDAMQFFSLPDAKTYDRSTAVGAQRQSEEDRLRAAKDKAHYAGVDAAGLKRAYEYQLVTKDKAKAANDEAQKAYDHRRRQADVYRKGEENGNRNKAGRVESLNQQEVAIVNAKRTEAQLEQEMVRLEEAKAKWQQAESAARKANIEVMRTELQILQERENRMASTAQTVGAMSIMDREMAKESLRAVQEHVEAGGDIAELPEMLQQGAAKLAPDFIAKQQEKSGAAFMKDTAKEFKGLDSVVMQDFEKETIAQVRAKVDKVKADVRVQVDLDAKQLSEELLKGLRETLGEFVRSIKAQQELFNKEIQTKQEQRAAHE